MRVVLLLAALAGIACAENWAVIVVGSKGFMNYRHHADGCHAYHILRKGGVPESNIILMVNPPGACWRPQTMTADAR